MMTTTDLTITMSKLKKSSKVMINAKLSKKE